MRHLITLRDLTRDQVEAILDRAAELKARRLRGERPLLLQGRVLVQVFEKPSLRTRVSFDAAIGQLGGHAIFLTARDAGLDGRETVADVARVLGSYCDVLVLRTFSEQLIVDFATHAGCHVVNGLTDSTHPCQALTDILTMQEALGEIRGRRLAFVGDGNNVAVSLATICAMLGVSFAIASPSGYELPPAVLDDLRQRHPGSDLMQTTDPVAAVKHADIVYTDVWASMGQEEEKDRRAEAFARYQVNAALMSRARKHARFLHCLPARRGLEVTDDVVEGPQSLVFPQAENRLHIAKGVLIWLLEG
jgi:ornithine carbamoyltransferase